MYQVISALCVVLLLTGNIAAFHRETAVAADQAQQLVDENSAGSNASPSRVRRQVSICQLPPNPIVCQVATPSFYYNINLGTCQSYGYGLCGGNANSFFTLAACQAACFRAGNLAGVGLPGGNLAGLGLAGGNMAGVGLPVGNLAGVGLGGGNLAGRGLVGRGLGGGLGSRMPMQAGRFPLAQNGLFMLDDNCYLPVMSGFCRGNIQRWYFDANTMTCRRFNYGGCGGNDNNYRSRMECQRNCNSFNDGMDGLLIQRGSGLRPGSLQTPTVVLGTNNS